MNVYRIINRNGKTVRLCELSWRGPWIQTPKYSQLTVHHRQVFFFVLNSTQLIILYILSNHPEYLFSSTFFSHFYFFPQVCGFFFKKRWGSQADKYILWQLAIIQFSIGSSVSCLWGWFKFGSFRKALVPCSFSHNLSRWQESWEESETDRKGSSARRFSRAKALGNLYDPSSDYH